MHYTIKANPKKRIYEMTLSLILSDVLNKTAQEFCLPAWIPGSYMIRDFSKHVNRVHAESDGRTLFIEKTDKNTWSCEPCSGLLRLSYEVYAADLSVRGAYLDNTHGFYNGSSVFLWAKGFENSPCSIEIIRPDGEDYGTWRVATALREKSAKRYCFGDYVAENYDELIDCPVEMGNFSLATFEACGIDHDLVLTGRHRADIPRLCRDLKTLCEEQLTFFGTPYPIKRYVFLVTVLGQGYGGLEHRSSCSLHCTRHGLPFVGDIANKTSREYSNFLGLCSHEYFHTWNIKRIKPAVFCPYAVEKETFTHLLWVFEGFTRYYEDLMLVRSGLITPEEYLSKLGEEITLLQNTPGRLKQTLKESSFDAWIKFYKQDENSPNATVSYYTKGGLIALLLDLTIRQKTNGKKSLDNLMWLLWEKYGQKNKGLQEGDIERLLAELLGENLSKFFDSFVSGLDELPFQELLATVGLSCDVQSKKFIENEKKNADLGIRGQKTAEGVFVSVVFSDSAAERAGIVAGDILLAIDGLKIQTDWEAQSGSYSEEEAVEIVAFRRDELMRFEVIFQKAIQKKWSLIMDCTDDIKTQALNLWLKNKS